jgi:hypothetical protein
MPPHTAAAVPLATKFRYESSSNNPESVQIKKKKPKPCQFSSRLQTPLSGKNRKKVQRYSAWSWPPKTKINVKL